MSATAHTADLPPPADPCQDRPARPVPFNINEVLTLLDILLAYARHLVATLDRRASLRSFSTIGQFFGTARTPVILARLARGMLRIQALQRVLLARAARGRDLVFLRRRQRRPAGRKPAPPLAPAAPAPAPPADCTRPPRAPQRDEPPDPANPATLEQLEAQIRARPIGCAIADICRDLGISPSACEGRMWNAVFCAVSWYRGNLPRLTKDLHQREVVFEREWDMDPKLDIPEQTREGVQRILGFFIGQPPIAPDWLPPAPGLAAGTGPP